MFERMCAWEDAGYMMACNSRGEGQMGTLDVGHRAGLNVYNGLVDIHGISRS